MIKIIIMTLFLVGILVATGIECTGNEEPNLRTMLYLNCSTNALPSTCWAVVSDNSTPPNIVGYYPTDSFSIDRETWYTTDDGKFIASIYVNEPQYSLAYSYNAEVKCVANDGSTNSTTFAFAPVSYATPDWIAYYAIFIKDNLGFVFALLLGLLILAVIVGYFLKKATGG